MDASRLCLIAAVAVVLTVPAAHAQDDEAYAAQAVRAAGSAKPWRQVRGIGRVLDLSKPPVVISEPGLYAIQQNWRFPRGATEVFLELIQITADDVTLDLHGFTISTEIGGPPPSTLFVITGNSAEIRNGGIEPGGIIAPFAALSAGGPWLHHLSVRSLERGMTFESDGTTISDSDILGPVHLAGESNLERNTIRSSGGPAVLLSGDGNRVVDNRLFPFRADAGVLIRGNGNVIANNVMDVTNAPVHVGFSVEGDHNVLHSNVALAGPNPSLNALWRISGTGNTLDGNIAPPPHEQEGQATIGMEFTADGNYYGNNRMSAQVPFVLGGTVQTDWGGNVGY